MTTTAEIWNVELRPHERLTLLAWDECLRSGEPVTLGRLALMLGVNELTAARWASLLVKSGLLVLDNKSGLVKADKLDGTERKHGFLVEGVLAILKYLVTVSPDSATSIEIALVAHLAALENVPIDAEGRADEKYLDQIRETLKARRGELRDLDKLLDVLASHATRVLGCEDDPMFVASFLSDLLFTKAGQAMESPEADA